MSMKGTGFTGCGKTRFFEGHGLAAKPALDRETNPKGPEGRPPNVSPARQGWGINPEDDPERRRRGTIPVVLRETLPRICHCYSDDYVHAVLQQSRTERI
jgi:hypothetical protein